MKKLIALIMCLALVLSFSFAVMAAPVTLVNQGTAGSDNNGTQSIATTFDASTMTFVTTVTGVTDQATLLVFKGDTLTTSGDTNIQYIDQITVGTSTVFTYKLKTDPAANELFTIKVGGSNLATPLSQYVKPIEVTAPATYTITGTIGNAAIAPNPDDYFLYEGDVSAFVADLSNTWKTTITLIPYSELNLLVKDYFDATTNLTETVIATTSATEGTGAFTLTVPALAAGVTSADYAMVVRREGFAAFFKKITFANADINLSNNINLLEGDIYGSVDITIGPADMGTIFVNQGDYTEGIYNKKYDLTADGAVGPSDLGLVFSNQGEPYSVEYAADGIDIWGLYFE